MLVRLWIWGFGVLGLGFGVLSFGFRVGFWGLGFERLWGLGLRAWGLGFWGLDKGVKGGFKGLQGYTRGFWLSLSRAFGFFVIVKGLVGFVFRHGIVPKTVARSPFGMFWGLKMRVFQLFLNSAPMLGSEFRARF